LIIEKFSKECTDFNDLINIHLNKIRQCNEKDLIDLIMWFQKFQNIIGFQSNVFVEEYNDMLINRNISDIFKNKEYYWLEMELIWIDWCSWEEDRARKIRRILDRSWLRILEWFNLKYEHTLKQVLRVYIRDMILENWNWYIKALDSVNESWNDILKWLFEEALKMCVEKWFIQTDWYIESIEDELIEIFEWDKNWWYNAIYNFEITKNLIWYALKCEPKAEFLLILQWMLYWNWNEKAISKDWWENEGRYLREMNIRNYINLSYDGLKQLVWKIEDWRKNILISEVLKNISLSCNPILFWQIFIWAEKTIKNWNVDDWIIIMNNLKKRWHIKAKKIIEEYMGKYGEWEMEIVGKTVMRRIMVRNDDTDDISNLKYKHFDYSVLNIEKFLTMETKAIIEIERLEKWIEEMVKIHWEGSKKRSLLPTEVSSIHVDLIRFYAWIIQKWNDWLSQLAVKWLNSIFEKVINWQDIVENSLVWLLDKLIQINISWIENFEDKILILLKKVENDKKTRYAFKEYVKWVKIENTEIKSIIYLLIENILNEYMVDKDSDFYWTRILEDIIRDWDQKIIDIVYLKNIEQYNKGRKEAYFNIMKVLRDLQLTPKNALT
jgi:hypothetical protein